MASIVQTRLPVVHIPQRVAKSSPLPQSSLEQALPDAVLEHMLQYLSLPDLLQAEAVNRDWKQLVSDSREWHHVTFSDDNTSKWLQTLLVITRRHGAQVQTLSIHNCSFMNSSVLSMVASNLVHVHSLTIRSCKTLTDEALASFLLGSSRSLERLELPACPQLSDISIDMICKANSPLEAVNFSFNRLISPLSIMKLTHHLRSTLKAVNFKSTRVTDEAVVAMSSTCSQLMSIRVGGSGLMSDTTLYALANNCGDRLEVLDVAHSNPFGVGRCAMTDDGVKYIASKCPQLREICLRGQGLLTKESEIALKQHCPKLTRVGTSGCRQMRAK